MPDYWIFQATPKQYNLPAALDRLDNDRWTIPDRYRNQIHRGDKVFFWKAGGKEGHAGIYAYGEITSDVGCLPELPEARPFVVSRDYLNRNQLRADVKYEKKFHRVPFLKDDIVTNDELKNLLVIKFRAGQIFRVRDDEVDPLCRYTGALDKI